MSDVFLVSRVTWSPDNSAIAQMVVLADIFKEARYMYPIEDTSITWAPRRGDIESGWFTTPELKTRFDPEGFWPIKVRDKYVTVDKMWTDVPPDLLKSFSGVPKLLATITQRQFPSYGIKPKDSVTCLLESHGLPW